MGLSRSRQDRDQAFGLVACPSLRCREKRFARKGSVVLGVGDCRCGGRLGYRWGRRCSSGRGSGFGCAHRRQFWLVSHPRVEGRRSVAGPGSGCTPEHSRSGVSLSPGSQWASSLRRPAVRGEGDSLADQPAVICSYRSAPSAIAQVSARRPSSTRLNIIRRVTSRFPVGSASRYLPV
jgi:hypothetical protein